MLPQRMTRFFFLPEVSMHMHSIQLLLLLWLRLYT
jgi:hypothetical protein